MFIRDRLYGVQFHPEVLHTVHGTEILKDFLYKVCGLAPEMCIRDKSMPEQAIVRQ